MLKQLWQFRAIQLAVSAGVFASLCCVGPPLAVLLGVGSAAFIVSLTESSPYFYSLSLLSLAGASVYILRRQRGVCSIEDRRRNRWLFPSVMAGVMFASFLFMTRVATPQLTDWARPHLKAGYEDVLNMDEMGGGDPQMAMKGGHVGDPNRPIMFVSSTSAPQLSAGTLRRAELYIDKMT
jgi:hypothetical protein